MIEINKKKHEILKKNLIFNQPFFIKLHLINIDKYSLYTERRKSLH